MRSIAPRAAVLAAAATAFWIFLGGLGFAVQETSPSGLSFSGYLVQGYRQTAEVAARNAPGLAAYFTRRGALAAEDRAPDPAQPEAATLNNWDFKEASFARSKLLASLDGGARARQPLLAAIAQVNFDCWVMPLPEQPGVPGGSECRRRFYFAFAGLAPPSPAGGETLETVQLRNQTSQPRQLLVQIASAGGPGGAASASDPSCTKDCLPLAFIGSDAEDLIDALRRNGESGVAAGGPDPAPSASGGSTGSGDPSGGGTSSGTGSDPIGSAGGALNAVGAAADGAVTGAGNAASGAASNAGNAVGAAAGVAGSAVSGAGSAVGGAVSGAGNAVSGAANGVGGAVAGAVGGLSHALGGVGSKVGGKL